MVYNTEFFRLEPVLDQELERIKAELEKSLESVLVNVHMHIFKQCQYSLGLMAS